MSKGRSRADPKTPAGRFRMNMIDLEAFKENRLELPPEGWEWMNITPEAFREHQTRIVEREKRVPRIGAPAPDFEIERLSPEGRRTGERFRLSSVFGTPIGLVFGSYT